MTSSLSHGVCRLGVLLSFLLLPGLATAQGDMSFGEEEVDNGVDDGGEEGDGFTFTEDDVEEDPDTSNALDAGTGTGGTVALVAVPTSSIDGPQRQEVQDALTAAMSVVTKYETTGPGGLIVALEDNEPERCASESICLATIGEAEGAELMLLARVSEVDGVWRLDLDFFNVETRSFVKYESIENLSSYRAAVEMIDPTVRRLFGVRETTTENLGSEDDGKPWLKPVFGGVAAALAVGGIAGGAVFGNRARTKRDAIINGDRNGEEFTITQRQAREEFTAAQRDATTANIFYGLGVAFGALSVVLFTVDFGGDVATEEELEARRIRDLRLEPAVSREGAGAGFSFRF